MIKSIKYKITLSTGICTAIALIILLIVSLSTIRDEAMNAAKQKLVSESFEKSILIQKKIEGALNTAKTLEQTLAAKITSNVTLSRAGTDAILKQILNDNPDFLGTYTLWEPNAFDNDDAKYVNSPGHDATGRYIPYWVRSNGKIVVEALVDYEKSGAGDYYQVPKAKMKECIIDPFLYKVNGKDVLLTSLIVPIIVDNKFYGITGVDINLEFLQTLAEDIDIYGKKGKLALISNAGIISAVTGQKNLLGKNIADVFGSSEEIKKIVTGGKQSVQITDESVSSFIPINIGNTGTPWSVNLNVPIKEITREVDSLFWKIVLGGFLLLLISMVIIWFISQKLASPIIRLTSVANKIAGGDINVTVEATTKDEVGDLERSFIHMIQNIKQQSLVAERIAQGDTTVEAKVQSKEDVLSVSLNKVVQTVRSLVSEVLMLNNAAVEGKLSTRGSVENFQGDYKEIIIGMNSTFEATGKPLKDASLVLETMAGGDLTGRLTSEYPGDYKLLKDSINKFGEAMCTALGQVTDSVEATASASTEISSSSEQLAAGVQEQSAQTTEIASAIQQMATTISQTTKNATVASQNAVNASEVAREGGNVINATIEGMNRIAEVVKNAALTVQELGSSSEQIGTIVQVIDDIADQTNLLALNAAIEAARAGEQGRGFAVVADEVRKLAERTTKATKEIASMVKKIQSDTSGAVSSMKAGTLEVEKGKELAKQAGESLSGIIKGALETVDISNQVAAASQEQSSAAEQISKSIDGINSVTQESAIGVQEIAKTAEDLSNLTINLQELILQFKIGTGSRSEAKQKKPLKSHITNRLSRQVEY